MKKNKVLTMLYMALALVICIILFCVVGVIWGALRGNENVKVIDVPETDVKQETPAAEEVAQTEKFDNFIKNSQELSVMSMDINGVKADVFFVDNYEEKPLVILQHGLLSSRKDMEPFATTLAQNGYLVVTPDAAGHGENVTTQEMDVMDMVKGTSDSFETVIRYFAESEYVNIERTAVMGFSLGGLTSFYYAANGSYTPKVVVTFCATPQFENLTESKVVYKYYVDGKTGKSMDQQQQEAMKEKIISMSPYDELLQEQAVKYFLLCGDKDEVVPHEGNVQFYEEMKDVSADMVLIVKEGQNHEIVVEDLQQALDYLKVYL